MVVLGFLFKNYKSYHNEIWLHTGKKNAESIYNVNKKKKSILSLFRANLHKLHNYEHFLSSKL